MENKICPICKESKDDVGVRQDDYAVEIGEEEGATMFSCDDCCGERTASI